MENRIRIPLAIGAAALAAASGTALFAQSRSAPYTVVETGKTYGSLQQAVDAIGGGKGSISIAPGLHADCAVQTAGSITYLAAEPGKAVLDGVTCEGKAALVLRGKNATVTGLVFQNLRVPDGNGAGIRLEQGNLTIAQSWFRDSQQGILTGEAQNGRIMIDKSTFTRLGTCEGAGGCAHSIYIGDYGYLRVTRSRFEQGRGGHYVKSRAAQVQIASCSFDDTGGRETNYIIDLPAGATGQITNNWFVQGTSKENRSALIAVGAEDLRHTSDGLEISGNDARLAPRAQPTVFVADWTGQRLNIGQNKLGQGLTRYERR